MKESTVNTHLGNIVIDNEVVAQYAGSAAMECFGIVGMADVSVKDGLFKLLKRETMTRGINVTILPNNKVDIVFHIYVAYGVSIMTVSDNLISNVKYVVEANTGLEVNDVNIYVEGVRVID